MGAEGNGRRGIVMVYTGNGKGKTTAAMGLALRAIGHGSSVFMIQFMKGPGNVYGEHIAARKHLPGFTIVQTGREEFVNKRNPLKVDIEMAANAMDLARKVLAEGKHDLVILDEINVAVDFGLVKVEDVVGLLAERQPHVDVVLTGRHAPPEIVEAADMVSEVCEVKHHYRSGIQAREGVEF